MRRLLLLSALLLTAIGAVKAETHDVVVGGIKYACDTETMEATVLGPEGDYDDEDRNKALTAVTIQTGVTYSGQSYKVTTIGKKAFYSWDYIKEVDIPEGIVTIEEEAFLSMYRLTKVTLPSTVRKIGLRAFAIDRALVSFISRVTDPSAVDVDNFAIALQMKDDSGYDENDEYVSVYSNPVPYQAELYVPTGKKAAYEGTNFARFAKIIEGEPKVATVAPLKYQYFTDSKTAKVILGGYSALTSVDIPAKVTISGTEYAVTAIENLAFDGCDKLKSVKLHEGLQHIGSFAFRDNKVLTDVTFPGSLTEIRTGAFWNCVAFKNVVLPEGLTSLGTWVFEGCTGVETVELPSTLKKMEYRAFTNMTSLKTVTSFVQEPFDLGESEELSKVFGAYVEVGGIDVYQKSTATLRIPEGTASAYASKRWSTQFASVVNYEKPTPTLSFPKATYTAGSGTFTEPVLNNPQGVEVTYSSSTPETIAVNASTGSVTILKTGSAKITASFAGNVRFKPASASYTLTATVTPVTVTADDLEMYYGDAVPTLTYKVTGGTLSGTPSLSCTVKKTSAVGEYEITVAKGSVTNSNVSFKSGKLTVKKAPLTIKGGNYTKREGEPNPAFTLTYEGLKNGETSSVLTTAPLLECEATKDSPVGEYVVKVSGAAALNYEITCVNGLLTISSWAAGDANGSGTVDMQDAEAIRDYLMGRNPSPFYKTSADANGDGKVNVADIVSIIRRK